MLFALCAHIASEIFNLTSFSVLSNPSMLETVQVNMDGDVLDRVMMNEHAVYVRICVYEMSVYALAIMTDNDILQTKYMVYMWVIDPLDQELSIGDSVHIIIENVTENMGTTIDDAAMMNMTTICVNNVSDLQSYGIWASTVKPENVTVELDCKVVEVVENSTSVITAKCNSETTWGESVFNRIQIWVNGEEAIFGYDWDTNRVLFGTRSFPMEGSVPYGWKQYNVTGNGSNLTIGGKLTIMDLPESFVSYWVDTIHANAWMGRDEDYDDVIMLVPPE